jgi:hypothetical protein
MKSSRSAISLQSGHLYAWMTTLDVPCPRRCETAATPHHLVGAQVLAAGAGLRDEGRRRFPQGAATCSRPARNRSIHEPASSGEDVKRGRQPGDGL